MSKLFMEAIAEAKQLRQLAEENAKNKIIESMTPKIRQLIEQELIDALEEVPDEDQQFDYTLGDVLVPDETEEDHGSIDLGDLSSEAPLVSIQVDGTANIGVGAETEMEQSDEEDELVELTKESANALAQLLASTPSSNGSFIVERKIRHLQTKINKFDKLLEWGTLNGSSSPLRESARKHYTQLLKEMISLRGDVIFTEGATEKEKLVRSRFSRLVKEMKNMSRRHAETLFNRLFEMKEDEEVEELDMNELDLVFDEDDLDSLGVEDAEGVDVAGLDVGVEMAGAEGEGEEEEMDAEEDIDLEELDIILSDDDLDVLGVEDPADADVAGLDVGVEMSGGEEADDEGEEEAGDDEEFEISESMLRRELRRMRRLREQDEAVDADPFLDHGGEEVGDVVVDVDEEDLINALADELGPAEVETPTVESRIRRRLRRRVAESRARRTSRRPTKKNSARRNRALSGKLVEYKNAVGSLRNQLNEMNLFNAKLLYVNKLMQNRNLTPKQQRAIVEALDNAKTLREAKLLYKSLTSSLNKRSTLKEGKVRRTLGSSSRSTRSAQPSTSGVEVDRWAVLAGINNKNK